MQEIKLEEIKKIELDILLSIDSFCTKHHIRYFLSYGTLLGAIRHKGFIPWDDDIDIMMLRDDYDKFNLMSSQFEIEEMLKVTSFTTDKKYIYPYVKVSNKNTLLIEKASFSSDERSLGVFVDVFPIDNVNDNFILYIRQYITARFWRNIARAKYLISKNLLKRVLGFIMRNSICKIFSNTCIQTHLHRNAVKYKYNKTNRIACLVAMLYGRREVMQKEIFSDQQYVEFEGHLFPAPKGYHDYLTNLYDDYYIIPPHNKQTSRHTFSAYWIERESSEK